MNSKNCKEGDYRLIKNPFVCKTSAPVRITLDKEPVRKIGNTQYIKECQVGNNTMLINELDPKLNYIIGLEDMEEKQMSFMDKYDYEVPAEVLNKNSKVEHKEGLPLSFIQIQTEEEGMEWYAKHYPKLPDDLLPIIARYHWGEPITKKSLKNEKKKMIKKEQSKGLVRVNKNVSLSFD